MPIGLDLGTHNFKAVELKQEKGRIELLRFGLYENPKINLNSESKDGLIVYAAAIREFFAQVNFSSKAVSSALPESEVFTRVIKVPQMSEKELKSSITFEAEQYIPLPLKEVSFDFEVIDSDLAEKDKMNVLLVAAKNSVLNKYVEIIKGANLTPQGLEPETLSVARALGDSEARPSGSLIVNINSEDSQIIIVHKGHVRFTRSMSVGGESLTRAVSQSLNLDLAQAEEYKKTYGLESNQADGKVSAALRPIFDNVLMETKRSKVFYTTHNPNVMIDRIVICGGTALMPGLLFYMANNLDLEVELANPWRNVVFSSQVEKQKEALARTAPAFVTAVGLALKDLKV